MKRQLARLIKDIVCGRRSGFRPCCILFFVGVWQPFVVATPASLLYHRLVNFARRVGHDWGGIPCPVCLLFRAAPKAKECANAGRMCQACGFCFSLIADDEATRLFCYEMTPGGRARYPRGDG